jgi:hypothetical protein
MAKSKKPTAAQLKLRTKADKYRTLIETHLCDIDDVFAKYCDEPTRQALGEEWLRGLAAGLGVSLLDLHQLIEPTIDIELDRGESLGIKRNKSTVH